MNAGRCVRRNGAARIARVIVRAVLCAAVLSAVVTEATAQVGAGAGQTNAVRFPVRPAEGEFIADSAEMITAPDAAAIRATAASVLSTRGVAIVVCTIPSLDEFDARGERGAWTIERFAMNLFDEWGIGSAPSNRGVLLLVSKGDRRARIQLGRGFDRAFSLRTDQIMSQRIVPLMKQGDQSAAIRAGVEAIAAAVGSAEPAAGASEAAAVPGEPVGVVGGEGASKYRALFIVVLLLVVGGVLLLVIFSAGRSAGRTTRTRRSQREPAAALGDVDLSDIGGGSVIDAPGGAAARDNPVADRSRGDPLGATGTILGLGLLSGHAADDPTDRLSSSLSDASFSFDSGASSSFDGGSSGGDGSSGSW